jgi:hypothetical protein
VVWAVRVRGAEAVKRWTVAVRRAEDRWESASRARGTPV